MKNIKKSENTICASYVPENSEETGEITLNIDGDIIDETVTSYGMIYHSHARQALEKIFNQDVIPKVQTVMWY
ncbi:MAG: hypothetical protein RR198_05125 [Oscillospiraceae bacterium]